MTTSSFSIEVDKHGVLAGIRHNSRPADFHFRIVHRFRMPGSICLPGEEILAVLCACEGREYQLQLPLAQLILFDFLARHARIAQSAKQIELGIRADDFYREHAKNSRTRKGLIRRIPRSAVREYVKRLHQALAIAFHEANLSIDPKSVLLVWETVGNERLYQLKSPCRWTHLDLTSRDARAVWA